MTRQSQLPSVESLELMYSKYNHRRFVHPDPLEFLYEYPLIADREIVAVIASSLAYGRVKQILISVSIVLGIIGSPSSFVTNTPISQITQLFSNFKHRFSTGREISELLFGIGRVIEEHGSLCNCFKEGIKQEDSTILGGLNRFSQELLRYSTENRSSLIPNPNKGSACKRLNLMLRWLVRKDSVDLGGWDSISPSKLVIPLDTHMHKVALSFGLTTRKNANMQTALEITKGFARLSPDDPTKYDFALTRPGIWDNFSKEISEGKN